MISFRIPGKIVAKQSMRFTRAGRRYQPGDVISYQSLVKVLALEAMAGTPPLDVAVKADISIVIATPESWSAKRKRSTLWSVAKPDLDNAAKMILDGIKGVVVKDDKFVASLTLTKLYGGNDYVSVRVTPMEAISADQVPGMRPAA